MAAVVLEGITKAFGKHKAVNQVSMDIAQGEFIVLLGPSGCGKTTVLRMIGGFISPDRGRIRIGREDVTDKPSRERGIGMVFQNYALFPNMSVAENVIFGLRERRADKEAIRSKLDEMLRLVRLQDYAGRSVTSLSGGQQQRVALARALAISPAVLLMDEPMAALDLKLRETMQVELRRVQRQLGITTILVTHDQHEAMGLADRIVIMSDGEIQQIGTAQELYSRPASKFVADFIGKNNALRGTVASADAAHCVVDLGEGAAVTVANQGNFSVGERLDVVVRPEELKLGTEAPSSSELTAKVQNVRFLGNVVHCTLALRSGQEILLEQSSSLPQPQPGAEVRLSWSAERACTFRSDVAA